MLSQCLAFSILRSVSLTDWRYWSSVFWSNLESLRLRSRLSARRSSRADCWAASWAAALVLLATKSWSKMRFGLFSEGMGRPWRLKDMVWAPRGEPVPPSVPRIMESWRVWSPMASAKSWSMETELR